MKKLSFIISIIYISFSISLSLVSMQNKQSMFLKKISVSTFKKKDNISIKHIKIGWTEDGLYIAALKNKKIEIWNFYNPKECFTLTPDNKKNIFLYVSFFSNKKTKITKIITVDSASNIQHFEVKTHKKFSYTSKKILKTKHLVKTGSYFFGNLNLSKTYLHPTNQTFISCFQKNKIMFFEKMESAKKFLYTGIILNEKNNGVIENLLWTKNDEYFFASYNNKGTIKIWSLYTQKSSQQIHFSDKSITMMDFNADDSLLGITTLEGIIIIDIKTSKQIEKYTVNRILNLKTYIAWHPYNKNIFALYTPKSNRLKLFDIRKGAQAIIKIPNGNVSSICWNNDIPYRLAVGSSTGEILLYKFEFTE